MAQQKTFTLEIVTPERRAYSGEVIFAVFPGAEGEFGVMAEHAATLAILVPGEIKVTNSAQVTEIFATVGGFVEILHNKATAAVESAEKPEEIDVDAAKNELGSVQGQLASVTDPALRQALKTRKRLAEVRLKVVHGSVHSSPVSH